MTITYYTILNGKIKTELKIVLLTDLHSCSYGDKQTELIEAIHRQEPDIVMMSGDIADDVLPDYKVKQLLDGIGDRYPCYYVTGNHEFWSNRVDEQKDMFRSYGVNVLEGTGGSITLNGQIISVYGVDDPDGGLERFESQLTAVGSSIIARSIPFFCRIGLNYLSPMQTIILIWFYQGMPMAASGGYRLFCRMDCWHPIRDFSSIYMWYSYQRPYKNDCFARIVPGIDPHTPFL